MNKDTLKALKASIKHWERMRDGKKTESDKPLSVYCSLCGRFNENYDGGKSCTRPSGERCPVFVKTGVELCSATPYDWAFKAWKGGASDFQIVAGEEVAFLKRLLPKVCRKQKPAKKR